MKVAWHPIYCHPLPEGHRFPMEKYDLLPQQLLREGVITEDDIFSPSLASDEVIALAHTQEYIQKLNTLSLSRQEERATGFPLSKTLVDREKTIVQGSIHCIQWALKEGIAFNAAGGTHHACSDHGEGFCLYNDIAVSSLYALKEGWVKKILVIDLDVHQGNGTAEILGNHPDVFTLSVHGANNYPLRKETSHWDIGFEDGTQDDIYLSKLQAVLPQLMDDTQADLIHYQAGVDVLSSDKLGRLSLSMEACQKRDLLVFTEAHKRNIPVVVTMGGGYSQDIKVIVDAHVNTYKAARQVFE